MSYIENYDSKSTEKKIRRAAANLSLKKGKDDNYNQRIYDEQLERKKEECENYLIEVGIKKIPNFQFAIDNLIELETILNEWYYLNKNRNEEQIELFYNFLTKDNNKYLRIFLFIGDSITELDKQLIEDIDECYNYYYNSNGVGKCNTFKNKNNFNEKFIFYQVNAISRALTVINEYNNCKKAIIIKNRERKNSIKRVSRSVNRKPLRQAFVDNMVEEEKPKIKNPFRRGRLHPRQKSNSLNSKEISPLTSTSLKRSSRSNKSKSTRKIRSRSSNSGFKL